jgi:hypothetical protein
VKSGRRLVGTRGHVGFARPKEVKMAHAAIYFVGPGWGTDAPSGYIGADGKWHPTPGWEAQSTLELSRALTIVGMAAQLKTPHLAESVSRGLLDFAQKELGQHLPQGGVLVVR